MWHWQTVLRRGRRRRVAAGRHPQAGVEKTSGGQSLAAKPPALRILLIEDDPLDAVWVAELIKENDPMNEVVHHDSLPHALLVLAQLPINAIFVGLRLDDEGAWIHACREVVRRAGRRSVVALINAAEIACAAEVRAAGVRFIYCKHPIWRTALIRKQQLREKFELDAEAGRQQRGALNRAGRS
jgi:CheY-like chemotaxis protein